MASLTITVGLPGSGKSYWASAEQRKAPDRIRIVNRDDIRASNCTSYEQGDEPYVAKVRDYMIDLLLQAGYDVISTDTNLPSGVQGRLKRAADKHGVDFKVQYFTDVPLATCLERNTIRIWAGDNKVPNTAIIDLYDKFVAPLRREERAG